MSWEPEKPITFIVPSNPGGGWDQTARFIQQTIIQNELLPVSLEVVNRGGGGGTIALAELVENSKGDAHKMMMTGFGMVGSALMHESDYSLSDVTPIARLTGEFQVIAVSESSPYQTLESLMEAFKADPKSISWAGGSAGGSDQIFIVQVAEAVGIPPEDVNYVAFTGGGEANAALMGNQVTAAITGFGEIKGIVDSGRVNLLAVSSETRIVDADLPTFIEKGINVTFQNWRGVVVPPGVSPEQAAYYVKAMEAVEQAEIWQEILKRNEWQDSFLTGPEFAAFLEDNKSRTATTLKAMGIGKSSDISAIGPYFFPKVVGIGLVLTILAMLWQKFGAGRALAPATAVPANSNVPTNAALANTNITTTASAQWQKFGLTLLLSAGYILALKYMGFMLATPLFIVALAQIIGSKSWLRDIIVAVVLTGLVILIFENYLHVSLPKAG